MKVLVTGASGFLGRHCVTELGRRGHEVVAPTRAEVDLLDLATHKPMLVGDFQAPDAILHLAWIATPGEFWTSDDNLSWLMATSHLAGMAGLCRVPRFVFAGTSADTATCYGDSKNTARKHLFDLSENLRFSAAYARIFCPYGPGDHRLRLIPSITRSMLMGEVAVVHSGDEWRDFVYVKDVACALAALVESDVTGTVDVGSGDLTQVRDVALMVAAKLKTMDLLRVGGDYDCVEALWPRDAADPTRLRDEVGYAMHYPLDEGLDQAIAAWR